MWQLLMIIGAFAFASVSADDTLRRCNCRWEFEEVKAQLHDIQMQLQSLGAAHACPDGFSYISSVRGCYRLVAENKNWDRAAEECRSLNSNAHLLVIDNAAEQQAIKRWMDDKSDDEFRGCWATDWGRYGFWTAGQRINRWRETPFVWKIPNGDGSLNMKNMTYTNWRSGQPNYFNRREACMNIYSAVDYKWNDHPCGDGMCLICEVDL